MFPKISNDLGIKASLLLSRSLETAGSGDLLSNVLIIDEGANLLQGLGVKLLLRLSTKAAM